MAELRLGTSGWSYPEWVGHFYPNGTSPARMLDFYARRFDAVEAHSSFRSVPTRATLERWCSQVPADFRFVPKVHAGITHRRDREGLEERLEAFLAALAVLGGRLGPVLFSLPHKAPDLDRLERLLSALPTGGPAPAAFDLKPAWAMAPVIDRLADRGCALVLTDEDSSAWPAGPYGVPSLPSGSPFTYVRLRRQRYDRSTLEAWAERLGKASAHDRPVYAFVKHDHMGDGPRYARQLGAALGRVV